MAATTSQLNKAALKAEKRQKDRCRSSQRRTIETVRSAAKSWSLMHAVPLVRFEPQYDSCDSLSKSVKVFLASCPSDVEEHRMAFQSIKKLLPPSCSCMDDVLLERLIEGMFKPSPSLPPGYRSFARRMANRLFPPGWDSTYRDHCTSVGPSLHACHEVPRSLGGAVSLSRRVDQHSFLERVYGTQGFDLDEAKGGGTTAVPVVVQSAGKPRPLAKFSRDCLLIKPLHKSMYDRLSRYKWLNRGDVRPESLDNAGFNKGGGMLVSGDYKSATDNLPIAVAELILNIALRNATRVPESVAKAARLLMRPLICTKQLPCENKDLYDAIGHMSSSQQMGSLLSFPLLCCQNYIAFRWAAYTSSIDHRTMPVLINGDDILFQTNQPNFYRSWVRTVTEVGLEVELTKTSSSFDYGSLNSTLLRWRGGYLRVVPTARMGMLRTTDVVNSLATNFRKFVAGLPDAYTAGRQFLLWHKTSIIRSGRTPRALGFRGALAWKLFEQLKLSRVAYRDIDFGSRSLPAAPTLHNYVLSRTDVEMVPVKDISAEDRKTSIREMTSWKWNLHGDFQPTGSLMSYLAALSRPGLRMNTLNLREDSMRPCGRFNSRPTRSIHEVEKEEYFKVAPSRVKVMPFFSRIERLPGYDEVSMHPVVESGDPLDIKSDRLIEKSVDIEGLALLNQLVHVRHVR